MLSGNLNEARKYCLDALRIVIDASSIPSAINALAGLGNLQAQEGNIESAYTVCYYLFNHSSSEEETKSRVEEKCTDLEQLLDSGRIMLLRKKAIQKTFAEIVDLASE